ncbi:uncharacterized protein [Nicotiana tomentosiformis]|uniref:uncharacterized protein n=1 Tax=Nicotiana tomentosiformis TaxID=4098 RepID=UPI00388C52DF
MTPYEAVYGQNPPPLLPYMPFDSQLEVVDRSLQAAEATLKALNNHLERAQHRMKMQVDKGITERTYNVGIGVGSVAYTLDLPPHYKIHPTFHIPLLKKKLGNHTTSVTLPVMHSESGHVLLEPEAIVDRRLAKKHGEAIAQVLVKWLNAPPEDSTWEDLQSFKLKFPHFNP